MSLFPPELLFDVLLRLSPRDLIRSMCVSKAWYALIHGQNFIKAHVERSIKTNSTRTIFFTELDNAGPSSNLFSLRLNDNETFGTAEKVEKRPLKCPDAFTCILDYSVKGLLCIYNSEYKDLALWNPSIQKFKKIPFPIFEHEASCSGVKKLTRSAYGFGFDLANHDYKVVALVGIVEFVNGYEVVVSNQVKAYSLKSNSWKRIQNMPCNGFELNSREMVFLNGSLCWLMANQFDNNRHIILTLDLASEKYQEYSTPVDESYSSVVILGVLEDYLCIFVDHSDNRNDVWIMKEHGVTDSWTLLYSIEKGAVQWFGEDSKPLMLSKNGEMVLLTVDFEMLFWFDLKTKSGKQVKICGLPGRFLAHSCMVGSLCLLDGDPIYNCWEAAANPF